MNIFLSYNFDDEAFVQHVSFFLTRLQDIEAFCYADKKQAGLWKDQLEDEIRSCDGFVVFWGEKWGTTQRLEIKLAKDSQLLDRVVVRLPTAKTSRPSKGLEWLSQTTVVIAEGMDVEHAHQVARELAKAFDRQWVTFDGLPEGTPFIYEKEIITAYLEGNGKLPGGRIACGCPENWPVIERLHAGDDGVQWFEHAKDGDLQKKIGKFRTDSDRIVVDSRRYILNRRREILEENPQQIDANFLTFLEAGPRERVCFPKDGSLQVGILVSGGIAPGINAVIAGIFERHLFHMEHHLKNHEGTYNLSIYAYRDGLSGLIKGGNNYRIFHGEDAHEIEEVILENASSAGALFGTSRANDLLPYGDPIERESLLITIARTLKTDGIDILYVIGGEGSMCAAHAILTTARMLEREEPKKQGRKLSVVGVPKAMDNDILWVWQSFGFLSAVQRAKELLLELYTESHSNPRLCVVQLFGSDSGFVVSHAALATGVCDLVLIPEVPFTIEHVAKFIFENKLQQRYRPGPNGKSPYGMILMAENAIPEDYKKYINDPEIGLAEHEKYEIKKFDEMGWRVQGQTPDGLRTGGLKIVSRALERLIRERPGRDDYWKSFRVFTSEPRHLLRAIHPSSADVIYAHRLGVLAVDNALAGYTDFMVSQWLTEYVLVPLQLVVLGRKKVPKDGIFWKSVLANTGQPSDLGSMTEKTSRR